jgi:hypothetical protein
VKITNAEIKVVDEKLLINGQQVTGLFERAEREPSVVRQLEITASLPIEDITPGHVMPAVALTTSRAS